MDVGIFSRILSNILQNSIEAISNSGTISITLESSLQHTVISISDNGCGIPESVLERLGKSDLTYGKANGNGLALQHAYSTIHSWNGTLKLDSKLNNGTTVTIVLPAETLYSPEDYVI